MNLQRWIRYVENWGPDGVLEAAAEDGLQGQDLARLRHTIEVWQREYTWVPDNRHKTVGGIWEEKPVREQPIKKCLGCGLDLPAERNPRRRGPKRKFHNDACRKRYDRKKARDGQT